VSELNTTLDDLISNGVALDLFEAKQARMLLDHLGLNAVAINTKGFGRIFGQLQTTLERSFVLMLCRLLEREVQKYKIRSIPAALKFLDENHETSQILNRPHIVEFMMQRGFDHAPLNALPDSELTSALVSEFHSILPISDEREHDLGEAISQLRTIRDKGIAHHEVVEVSELPSVKRYDIDALMEGVSELIDVVGPSYLAVHHDLDRDVKKTESSLEKLLRAAGVYS
jgi:hypothetical protein